MMRRIVANLQPKPGDDLVTKAMIERLHTAFEKDGDSLNPLDVISSIQEFAFEHPLEATEQQIEAMNRYIEGLPEPQQTIFRQHREGKSKHDIAQSMGIGVKPVCECLAKMYASLRMMTS